MATMTMGGGPEIIHLTYMPKEPNSQWRIACMPIVSDFRTESCHPNYLRSDDTRAVTCPACKKTKVFEEVRARE